MKHVLLSAAAMLCLIPASMAQTPLPKLITVGNHFETPDGKTIELKGVSLCSLEWHKPIEQINTITTPGVRWAANILRLPVQVREWDRVGPDAYIKSYLEPAVRACTKNNIYCIIDWHEIAAWNDSKVTAKLEDFWKRVAPLYADNPNILYEFFNEPTDPTTRDRDNWLKWRETAQKWVDMIRKDAPETVILVNSPHWSQMPSFAAKDPFRGENLAYVMHLYPNWKHHQWDSLIGEASKTIPIFISEWGWSNQPSAWWGIKGSKESYGQPFREYLDAKPQINWTAWSYDPLCGPAMLGPDKDMGAFVKQWLSDIQRDPNRFTGQ